jgi:hypothetical protein
LLKEIARWDFRLIELHTFFGFGKGDRQMGSQDKKKEKERKEERRGRKEKEERTKKKEQGL